MMILSISLIFFTKVFLTESIEKSGSIGLLIDLHSASAKHCSQLNTISVQHYLAAEWAVDIINNQSLSQGVRIGIELFDSCGDKDVALKDVFYAVKSAVDPRAGVPLLGLIGVGDPEIIGETVTTLHAFSIPLILASPRLAEMVVQQGNILTTAPDMNSVVQPVVHLGKFLGATSISLISSCPHSIKKFGYAAMDSGILLGRMLQIGRNSLVIGDIVKTFLDESEPNETIALILEPEEIYRLADYLRNFDNKKNIRLLTGTIGLNKNLIKLWKTLFAGGYLIEPHMPELPDFRNYILSRLEAAVNDSKQDLLREYIKKVYDCSWSGDSPSNCESLKPQMLAAGLRIDPEVTFVVKAVSAFSAALFLIEAEHCREQSFNECSALPPARLQESILPTLTHLSIVSNTQLDARSHKSNSPLELQGASLHVTHTGHLVSNKFIISVIQPSGEPRIFGWWSLDQGLVTDATSDSVLSRSVNGFKIGPSDKTSRQFEIKIRKPYDSFSGINGVQQFFGASTEPIIGSLKGRESGVDVKRVNEGSLGRSWATLVAAIATIGVFITIFIFIYVLIKICDRTLAGNQSLGLVLLFGVAVIYASTVLFILPANEIKCILRVFIHPIALSLCYGILIVKAMQLRALVLLGLGGRISYLNQYLILFFIVLVQLVISAQWIVTNRPHFRVGSEEKIVCYMPRQDFLFLHLYPTILVTIGFMYGLSVLKIRRNYKEGRWITLATGLSLPVLVALGLSRAFTTALYYDTTVCIVLILLASILITALFIPKMTTISKRSSLFKHNKMASDSTTTSSNLRVQDISRLHHHQITRLPYGKPLKNPIFHITTSGAYP